MKFNSNLFKKNLIPSISFAGILLAFVLIFKFIFSLFKVWVWSIEMFLVFYAIGIYKIKNIVVNIFFFLIVPPLVFTFDTTSGWFINPLQIFFEYFLAFYIFGFLYLSSFISNLFKNKKFYKLIDYLIFVISYSLLIIFKYLIHSIASIIWWSTENYWAALIFNSTWLATNSLTIIAVVLISKPIFDLFYKYNLKEQNKW